VVTAGKILAEAAIASGLNATHSQVYGPQSRGGASRSDVVISSVPIGFPLADSIDLLIALNSEAYAKYRPELNGRADCVYDSRCEVGEDDGGSPFPVVDTARAVSGAELVTGVVALGVLQAYADLVDADALRETVLRMVPARHKKMNLEAVNAGMEMVNGGSG
jgi:2-oxoglutarate ferredoxin oxidoreductase subunit gamma